MKIRPELRHHASVEGEVDQTGSRWSKKEKVVPDETQVHVKMKTARRVQATVGSS